MNASNSGRLVIISGPSGAGKSTVVRQLLDSCDLPLELSVSATTRQRRSGEVDGVDYHFLTKQEFAQRRAQGEFLECAEVFGAGNWYGTLEQPVQEQLRHGKLVVLEIDVQGALIVMDRFAGAVSIFIHPGSLTELERRLRGRETESEEQINRRLAVAADELKMTSHYQHVIENHDLQATADQICRLLNRTGEQKSCTTS